MERDIENSNAGITKKNSGLEEQKTTQKGTPFWRWLLTPILLMVLILTDHYSRINLTIVEMNITFLLFFFANLIAAVLIRKNLYKFLWLLDVLYVCVTITIYNVLSNNIVSISGFAKSFCSLWVVLTVPVLIYFINVCVRVILWSQESWEDIKTVRQNERKKRIILKMDKKNRLIIIASRVLSYNRAVAALKNAQKKESENQKQEAELQKQKLQYEAEAAEQKAKIEFEKTVNERRRKEKEEERQKEAVHKSRINYIRRRQKEEKIERRGRRRTDSKTKDIITDSDRVGTKVVASPKKEPFRFGEKSKLFCKIFITALLFVLFIRLPLIWGSGSKNIGVWMKNADTLMSSMKQENVTASGNDTLQMEFEANNSLKEVGASENSFVGSTTLVQYTIFYIAFIGCIIMAFLLCWKAVEAVWGCFLGENEPEEGFKGFFMEYSTPFSVLIVVISVLSLFTNDGNGTESILKRLPEFFENLAGAVLIMLLILVAVDAVRLILVQCIEKGSLLRTSFHLIFALLVENMMEIATGVLQNLNIGRILSSWIAFFAPTSYSKIYKKVERVLDDALKMEIKIIRKAMKKHVKKVSGKKQKSQFKQFHSSDWSRRY